MRIFLIIITVFLFSGHVQAEDSSPPALPSATSKVINEDDNAAPPTKTSLTDLRSQQIENENEDAVTRENTASPDADTDPDACTAKDISATMQMPANIRYNDSSATSGGKPQVRGSGYTLNGTDEDEHKPSKMALCKGAYDRMTDACYKGMPCAGCEAALKQFSTACGYVGREESMDGSPNGSVGDGGGRTLDGRRNVPVNKLPQR